MKIMNMDDQYLELVDVIQGLDISDQVFEVVGDEKDSIIKQIKSKFVIGEPRVWWLSFAKEPRSYIFDDEFQYKRIVDFFNDDEICYFIPEFNDLHIFKLAIKNIVDIISECSFFEYYIVSMDLARLLCETDHGDLLFIE
jgi:hypothetical protein